MNPVAWTALILALLAALHVLWHVLLSRQPTKHQPAHRASRRRPSGDRLLDYSYDDEDPWSYVRGLAGDDPTPQEMQRIVARVRESAQKAAGPPSGGGPGIQSSKRLKELDDKESTNGNE